MADWLSEKSGGARILYSSRTGNTRKLAEHLASQLSLPLFDARSVLATHKADFPEGAHPLIGNGAGAHEDILLLGFWTWRGGPNPTMREIMKALWGRRVFVFGTMAAWPDSDHARGCIACAKELLDEGGNELIGHFVCQGRLAPAVRKHSHHPRTPEREARLDEAEKHPDAADLASALASARSALGPFMP